MAIFTHSTKTFEYIQQVSQLLLLLLLLPWSVGSVTFERLMSYEMLDLSFLLTIKRR